MIGLGQGGGTLKYIKRVWNRTEGRGHKDYKKGGKLGQGVGALKRGGDWNPITNYVYISDVNRSNSQLNEAVVKRWLLESLNIIYFIDFICFISMTHVAVP